MISASMVKELREISGAGMLDCKKALEATNGNMEEAITWLREKGISKAAKKQTRIAAEGLAHIEIKGNKAVIIEVNSETDFVAKNQEFVNLVKTIASTIIDNNVSTVEEALKLKAGENTLEELIIDKTSKIGEKISFRRFEIVEKEDTEVFGTYSHMGGKIAVLTRLTNNEEVAKDVAMQAAAMRPLYLTREDVPSEVLEKERTILKEQAENEGLDPSKIDMIVNGRINKYYEEVCLIDQPFIKENKQKVSKYVESNGSKIISFTRYEVGEGMEKREENFAEEVMKQING
ncbi:MAG: translation elongation factor Ts [Bacilli bacterium]|jgi:elongation factor Ts|nr:translation elongation factor Ts [Clostridium sp.]MDY3798449.1 translation elongation factor Ts [Bacilli bacterium]